MHVAACLDVGWEVGEGERDLHIEGFLGRGFGVREEEDCEDAVCEKAAGHHVMHLRDLNKRVSVSVKEAWGGMVGGAYFSILRWPWHGVAWWFRRFAPPIRATCPSDPTLGLC